ncbi:hypothetical protein ABKA04_005851 [Annulohypoxylon sp. FPYF3050]
MSLNDHASTASLPVPHRPKTQKPSPKHADTQTDLQGLGWSSLNLPTTAAFSHIPNPGHPEQCQLNIEAAFRKGVEEGKRQAAALRRASASSSPLVSSALARSTTTFWPTIAPPRPVPRQPTPIPSSARGQRAVSRAEGEVKQEQAGQKSWCPKIFSRGREAGRGG